MDQTFMKEKPVLPLILSMSLVYPVQNLVNAVTIGFGIEGAVVAYFIYHKIQHRTLDKQISK